LPLLPSDIDAARKKLDAAAVSNFVKDATTIAAIGALIGQAQLDTWISKELQTELAANAVAIGRVAAHWRRTAESEASPARSTAGTTTGAASPAKTPAGKSAAAPSPARPKPASKPAAKK
jgi:hypothetical protein